MTLRNLLYFSVLGALTACGGGGSGSDESSSSNTSTSLITSGITKDALVTDQWYLDNTGTAPSHWTALKDLSSGADIGVKEAWDAGAKGKDIVVTIVDDGVEFAHPDLKSQELAGYSMSYDSNSPNSAQPADSTSEKMNDHGTNIAGVIAAQENTIGVVGIAPEAKLVGHRTIGLEEPSSPASISTTKILADKVSQVSNHSYGPQDNGLLHPQSTEEYDRIQALVTQGNNGKGHVMVFAAGNGGAYIPRKYEPSEINNAYATLDVTYDVEKNLGDYAGLEIAQQHPYIISVSGFDANNKTVTYAEAGPATLVAGATADNQPYPIVGFILRRMLTPTNATKKPAAGITTTGRNNVKYPVTDTHRAGTNNQPDSYSYSFNGTSASAPMVTGVVALLQSANPDLTWRDIRWILAKTARKIQLGENLTNQATGKPSTGEYAKPIWSTSGNSTFGRYSHYVGYGAVDAGAAVAMAKNNYTNLPDMKTCDLTVSGTQAYVGANNCPDTIEFVQVKYYVVEGTNISDVLLSMDLAGDTGKTINLITPTTCKVLSEPRCAIDDGNPNQVTGVAVKGGTVGFMGDTLGKSNNQGFNFSISTNQITLQAVKVFGH